MANVNNFTVFVTFIVINAVLVVLRYRKPKDTSSLLCAAFLGQTSLASFFEDILQYFMLVQLEWKVMCISLGLTSLGGMTALLSRRFLRSDPQNK